jgi:hypothetical protein
MLRQTTTRLASTTYKILKPQQTSLLPPIPLYRRLLRAHRKHLPSDLRVLGDEYVKAEFRAHRETENPVHLVGFLTEWQLYAQKIEGDSWVGERLDEGKISKMSGMFFLFIYFTLYLFTSSFLLLLLLHNTQNTSPPPFPPSFQGDVLDVSNIFVIDEQLGQLYELMRAIQKRDSGEEESSPS